MPDFEQVFREDPPNSERYLMYTPMVTALQYYEASLVQTEQANPVSALAGTGWSLNLQLPNVFWIIESV